MKFIPVSSTLINLNALIPQLGAETITQFDAAGVRLQSCNGYLRLLCALTGRKEMPPFYLEMWSWGFYFEMPFDLLEELITAFELQVTHIPIDRSDHNRGIMTATLFVWRDLILQSKYLSQPVQNLANVLRGIWDKEGLPSELLK